MKNKSNVFAFIALVLVLPSVLHAFSQEKGGIKIKVNDFMDNPYAHVMSNKNWTITAEDLQKHNLSPIKVKVINNTDKPICISSRSVKLFQVVPEEVAAKFKKRAILRPILTYFGTGLVTISVMQKIIRPIDMHPNATFQEGLKAGAQWSADNAGLLRIEWIARLAGSIAYGYYLSDINNQLVELIKQSSLDEMTTVAPNESVDKVILCQGMLSQNFKFNVFNKSHVPIAEFAVDLSA